MNEKKEQEFDVKQWLASKKKGFSGKIPRADLIAKIEELWESFEKLRETNTETENRNKKNEEKTKSLQKELIEKNKKIEEDGNFSLQLKTRLGELQEQIEEKEKNIIQKDNELKKRANITEDEYKEILNNQEKHKIEDLKPKNLPDNWEEKLLTIKELETRPTSADLTRAVREEADKYKDYKKLNTKEKEAIENYDKIKLEYDRLVKDSKKEDKEEKKIFRDDYNKLKEEFFVRENESLKDNERIKYEIKELKNQFEEYKKQKTNTNYEKIIFEMKKLVEVIESWKEKELNSKEFKKTEQSFFDYNPLKIENEKLWKIIINLNSF